MGVFGRIRESLSRTKQQIVERFDEIVRRADAPERRSRPIDVDTIEALEELLISADVGVAATERIIAAVRGSARSGASLRDLVKQEIRRVFAGGRAAGDRRPAPPTVTLIVGVNGTGKTTTVGKLANLLQERRAAAAHLRGRHVSRRRRRAARDLGDARRRRHGARARRRRSRGGRLRRHLVRQGEGTRSDARRHGRPPAHARQSDERAREDPPRRVARGARRAAGGAARARRDRRPERRSTQAREFTSVAGVNGIVLTKLDGTAKGGVAVAIAHDLKLPIRYVGVGEGIDDLVPFSRGRIRRRTVRGEVVSRRLDGMTPADYMDRARCFTPRRGGAAAPARIRWSARSSCRRTASWSARVITSAPASRTPRCTRSTMAGDRAHGRARCTARSSRAATSAAPARASTGSSRPASRASWRRSRIRIRSCSGRGFAYLRAHGVDVEVGLGAATATRLNQPFFTLMRERRPFVILKAATSLDGCIAEAPGRRDRADVGARPTATRTRSAPRSTPSASASGTILADDPLLTARGVYRERPLTRVVFDRRLRTPPDARVLSTREAGPVIIVTTAAGAARARRCAARSRRAAREIESRRTARSARRSSVWAQRGIGSLLLEGGAGIARGGVGRRRSSISCGST